MVTCIMPVHNEQAHIRDVLDVILNVKDLFQIICVDDGSTDKTVDIISKEYPQVKLVLNGSNMGKCYAVKKGLEEVATAHVLLIDADLKYLDKTEVSDVIDVMTHNSSIDMIILRRINAPWRLKLYRIDTLLSGERLLKTKDLEEICNTAINGYELEIAIDLYMYRNNKIVFWMPSSAVNTFKSKKVAVGEAILKELKMYTELIGHAGLLNFFRLFSKFGKQQLPVNLKTVIKNCTF